MIAVTPFITPLAVRIGARRAVAVGFGLAAVALFGLAFVQASWSYLAFVAPLAVSAVGLGLANGPASSASTSSVPPEETGQASGISNMARYVGGSLAVAAAGTVYSAVIETRRAAGAAPADALAAALSRSAILVAILSAAGVALALLLRQHRAGRQDPIDRVAAAAAVVHTIPTRPGSGS
jgi:MFS family permease